MTTAYLDTTYDSDEEPKTADECRTRLIEAIIWEFLDEDHGLFMASPYSTFYAWKEPAKKRYQKAAKKLKKELESGTNKTIEQTIRNIQPKMAKVIKNPTLRDYMRTYVGN